MSKYPQAYVEYLVFFHAHRDYFECHEVMEEYWKNHPEDPLSRAYVGLIQTAVAMYHQRRGNFKGAVKMLDSARELLTKDRLERLGIDADAFTTILEQRSKQLHSKEPAPFTDLDIPLADDELYRECLEQCGKQQLIWSAPSNGDNESLIHKHTLRDRSDVIEARARELYLRQKRG
ncbi:DUF309 domain-containing protein [Paenibacillus thalictri]|uniref:DUF309 domain-containing protein n=1 Tax=Paenibacillus thalictri TaxID=2527873 RepID=A0A4Q9DUZ1_9BACL|nr:DUF309 domain-containing protein [Paenibacillus thalictri]TBL80175.1 DUF309 domain-containing protein [Paenibacillus thalictri]